VLAMFLRFALPRSRNGVAAYSFNNNSLNS
jgi:hypothetical protein